VKIKPTVTAAVCSISLAVYPIVAHAAESADIIYTGGYIVTVNDAAPSAEALAVKDGKILAVGMKGDVLKTKGDGTKVIDWKVIFPFESK
jgi:imidazolonepropionase-like amidohydrolase